MQQSTPEIRLSVIMLVDEGALQLASLHYTV